MIESINWYPGHMKKTRELISENLKLVDMVIEVIDARIPVSSRNPIIDEIVGQKPRIVLLNKSDLSDAAQNRAWGEHFEAQGYYGMAMNCMSGGGVKELFRLLERLKADKNKEQVRNKPFRLMIVGVPNVGKSSLINRMTGKKSTKTGDRPGVTKGKQWLTLSNGMQLLDTPGILWPKFEDVQVGENLAITGAIKDAVVDIEELAMLLCRRLRHLYPKALEDRYKLTPTEAYADLSDWELVEAIGKKRGFLMSGGAINTERTAIILLDEFRAGKIGRITLDTI